MKITVDIDQQSVELLTDHYKVDSPETAMVRLVAHAKRDLERERRIVDTFNEEEGERSVESSNSE